MVLLGTTGPFAEQAFSAANLDAVFANANGTNRVCLGDGSGGFSSCSDVSGDDTITTFGVALAFVDGDGNLDAVFANAAPNQVCLGDGSGSFSCSDVSVDYNSHDVALGFVNSDANLDAVFANPDGENRACLGDGNGGFSCSDVNSETNATTRVALGLVDGNGNLDAVFGNFLSENRVCLGDGNGGFSCSNVSGDTNKTFGVALGDLSLIFVSGFESGDFGDWIVYPPVP